MNLRNRFDKEFINGEDSKFHRIFGDELKSRILWESDRFAIFPALGCFVEGYTLIISRENYISIGHMPRDKATEMESLCLKAKKNIQSIYGDVIVFEHGALSSFCRGGACLEQAHIHLVPFKKDVHNYLKERHEFIKIDHLYDLSSMIQENHSYIYYQNQIGVKYAYWIENVPSQYMRRVLIDVGEFEEYKWDSEVYVGKKEIIESYNKLLPKFKRGFTIR